MSKQKTHRKFLFFLPLLLSVVPSVYAINNVEKSVDNSLTVVDGDNKVEYKIIDDEINIVDILESYNEKIEDYRKKDGSVISKTDTVLSLPVVYKLKTNVNTNEVEIPFTVERKPNNSLFVGEEKTIQEGKNGKAIRTRINQVNGDSNDLDIPNNSNSVLTIIEQPVSKIVEYGTKPQTTVNRRWFTGYGNWKLSPSVLANIDDNAHPAIPLLKAQVGKQYVWGAANGNSFDCSGLVYWVYRGQLGYNIPRTAYPQGLSGTQISYDNIKPGDLVYNLFHIGVYVGDGKVIHAANPNDGVIVTPLSWFKGEGYKVSRVE